MRKTKIESNKNERIFEKMRREAGWDERCAFSQPPDEDAFLGVDHDDADDESDGMFVDEDLPVSPWSMPPDADTFLGGNPFLVSEAEEDDQYQTSLERELEELLQNPEESD